jgi:uncharacterized protein (TIGR04551 family)
VPLGGSPATVGQTLVKRNAGATVIDGFGRLHFHHLLLEAEGTLIVGHIGDSGNAPGTRDFPGMSVNSLDILQGGGMGRATLGFLHDILRLRLESGFASGDQAESLLPGQTNFMSTPIVQPPGDHTITNFHFDPDYHVDLILFRRILGTVTNAIYAKPSIEWDITDSFGVKLDVIASFPHVPVSTPGNGSMYGLEMDTTIGYRNVEEGFYAGFQYGVLFPFSALDQPTTGTPAPLFPVGVGSQGTAQTLRTYLAVKF